jgi:hypothetical protein
MIFGWHGGDVRITVFWDVTSCSLVEISRRFEGTRRPLLKYIYLFSSGLHGMKIWKISTN